MSDDDCCNVCENFPCLGNHPPGEVDEALERYERTAAFIRDGLVAWPAGAARPIYFSPFRNSLVIREGFAVERRAAEERGRREWTEGVRRRLGLVAEVHRCWVYDDDEGDGWAWFCRRRDCPRGGVNCPTQEYAFTNALMHARLFVPRPPEEPPVTELDVLAFDALWARMRAQQDAVAAALPDRMAAVAETVNAGLAGVLPEGVRFEWESRPEAPYWRPDQLLGARHDTPDMTGALLDFEPLPEADPAPALLRWSYGPTETDPDPGSMWCEDCGGQVCVFKDGVYVCDCGRRSET